MKSFMSARVQAPRRLPSRSFKPPADTISSFATLASAAAALAPPAAAATVQITLADNLFSSSSDNLNGDLTGDTDSDFPFITGTPVSQVRAQATPFTTMSRVYKVRVELSPSFWIGSAGYFFKKTNGVPQSGNGYRATIGFSTARGPGLQDLRELLPVSFTDSRVNGGSPTGGLLEVRAFNTSKTEHTIQLLRLVFDDADTSEPSGVLVGDTKPEFVVGGDPPDEPTDDLVDTFVNAATEAEKRAAFAKLKKLKNGIKKLKKKLKMATRAEKIKIKKKLKKAKKNYSKYQRRVAAIGVRG